MSDTASPADVIRAAATRLRQLAAAAQHEVDTNPYWTSELDPPHQHPTLYARGIDNAVGGPAGAFAAVMHPGVGHAVADWLDICADYADKWAPDLQANSPFRSGGLAVARAILGEDTGEPAAEQPAPADEPSCEHCHGTADDGCWEWCHWDTFEKRQKNPPAAWTPPPPGDTREQLPDHLLDLIRPELPFYLSTACSTGQLLAAAIPDHPGHAHELDTWLHRMHQRCRLNMKFTGQLCCCDCHDHGAEER